MGKADREGEFSKKIDMKIYQTENGSTPSWICGHWNGSPLEIGMGLRTEVGDSEVMHYHDYREYYIVLEGEAELKVEGEQIPLQAGMVVMVEPGEKHMVSSIGKTGAHWIVIKERSEPNSKYVVQR